MRTWMTPIRVLGVVHNGVARAYPLNLGWWHEVINDHIGDGFISVTYCPLTGTGLVFDANTDSGQLELGVSGLLLNSNLVLYDRRDDRSLYPQMTYVALVGDYRDESLQLLPVVETTWALWKRMHADTMVPRTAPVWNATVIVFAPITAALSVFWKAPGATRTTLTAQMIRSTFR
jgi:hypothetical protein